MLILSTIPSPAGLSRFASRVGQFIKGTWPIQLILGGSFILRAADIRHSVIFSDESTYSYVRNVGNLPWVNGDVYLWPVISATARAIGGVEGIRLVTAIFGTLTVAFVLKMAQEFARALGNEGDWKQVGYAAAIVFSISAPALFISTIGSYNAMSLSFYTFGFWQMMRGFRRESPGSLVSGGLGLAISFPIAFATYMAAPAAIGYAFYASILAKRKNLLPFFWIPFISLFAGFLANHYFHVWGALSYCENVVRPGQTRGGVLMEFLRLAGPIFAVSALGVAVSLRGKWDKVILIIYLGVVSAVPLGYHIWRGNDHGVMIKSLISSVIFASVLAGLLFARLAPFYSRGKWARTAFLALIISTLLVTGLFSRAGLTRWRNWPRYEESDYDKIVSAIQRAGTPPGTTVAVAVPPPVDELAARMGVINFGGLVNTGSPYFGRDELESLERAIELGSPYIVASLPESMGRPIVGSTFQGYEILEVVDVEGVINPQGDFGPYPSICVLRRPGWAGGEQGFTPMTTEDRGPVRKDFYNLPLSLFGIRAIELEFPSDDFESAEVELRFFSPDPSLKSKAYAIAGRKVTIPLSDFMGTPDPLRQYVGITVLSKPKVGSPIIMATGGAALRGPVMKFIGLGGQVYVSSWGRWQSKAVTRYRGIMVTSFLIAAVLLVLVLPFYILDRIRTSRIKMNMAEM